MRARVAARIPQGLLSAALDAALDAAVGGLARERQATKPNLGSLEKVIII